MKARIITALLLAPVVVALVLQPWPQPLILLASACTFLALREVWRMENAARRDRAIYPPLLAIAFGALAAFLMQLGDALSATWALFIIFAISVATLSAGIVFRQRLPLLIPATLWVVCPILAMMLLHRPSQGTEHYWLSPLLMTLLPVWAGDTAAIFVGKALGRNPLAPRISPGKTWEGVYAQFGGSILMGTILGPLVGHNWMTGAVCGCIAGFFGPMGDLLESALKRRSQVKDSGSLLPGHGGILDRLDSLLMPAIPIALVLLQS